MVSGSAICVVIATGDNTFFGSMAKSITGKRVETSFDNGVNSVSWLLIRFMMLMVPVVLKMKSGSVKTLDALKVLYTLHLCCFDIS